MEASSQSAPLGSQARRIGQHETNQECRTRLIKTAYDAKEANRKHNKVHQVLARLEGGKANDHEQERRKQSNRIDVSRAIPDAN